MTLKDDLITLQTDPTFAGANPATAVLIPGVDTNPAPGVLTFNTGTNICTVDVADDTFNLENWNFNGWQVYSPPNKFGGKLRNCLLGGDTSRGFSAYVYGGISGNAYATRGGFKTIERCTMDGGGTENPGAFIHGRSALVQNNRMVNGSNDYYKFSGWDGSTTSYCQGNFFGEPVAIQNDALAYNTATIYSVGEGIVMTVSKSGATAKPFIAVARNPGTLIAPPSTWGTNDDWRFIDPHADPLQADGDIVGPFIARWNNVILRESLRNAGLTAGMWPEPHFSDFLSYIFEAYANRIDALDHPAGVNSNARCFASPPASWIGTKPKFYNNWLRMTYNYMNSGGGAFDWGGNTMFDETPIPFNDPDVIGGGAVDYAAPAREANYPAGGIAGLSPQVGASSILDATGWNRDLVVTA